MKPVLFCSILIAFLSFSCKPKPIDNLKNVARQAEENKVFRVSRQRLAQETQRIADSVLTLVLSARQEAFMGEVKTDTLCSFDDYLPYRQFQEKYKGRAYVVWQPAEKQKLAADIAEVRKFNNQLPENKEGLPATFQTQNDTVFYVRKVEGWQQLCASVPVADGFWVFKFPKHKLVEVMTVKVKPKPAKGPNW
jgi:hypothetical protein